MAWQDVRDIKVFLSYAAADRDIAHRIRKDLTERGVKVFDVQESVLPGESIAHAITSEIKAADAVLFLISNASTSSPWVGTEIALAVADAASGKAKRLIPIKLSQQVTLPIYLQDFLALDLSDHRHYQRGVELLIRALSEPTTGEEFQEGMKSKQLLIAQDRTTLELDKLEYLIGRARQEQVVMWLIGAVVAVLGTMSLILVHGLTTGGTFEKTELFAIVSALVGIIVGALVAGFATLERRRRYKQEEQHVLDRIRALRNELAHGKGGVFDECPK